MANNWKNDLRADRRRVKDRIILAGQRATALKAGVNEMVISRFVRNKGTGSAEDLYKLAAAVGLSVVLVPAGSIVKVDGELFPSNFK